LGFICINLHNPKLGISPTKMRLKTEYFATPAQDTLLSWQPVHENEIPPAGDRQGKRQASEIL
jgi:hypothetical protein